MKGYCATCKKITDINNPQSVKLPNAKRVTKGNCAECGTEIWKKET